MRYHYGHEYADETLVDAANEVAKDERREKLLKSHLSKLHILFLTVDPGNPPDFT